jgi:hypothetical protein
LSPASAADLAVRPNRPKFAPASGMTSSTCVPCVQACRRRGGPLESACESLCWTNCGNR